MRVNLIYQKCTEQGHPTLKINCTLDPAIIKPKSCIAEIKVDKATTMTDRTGNQ